MSNPISQLRVIELSTVLAGPAVGMFFAELGAEVIKLENPNNPDITRKWKLSHEDKESRISGYFSAVNYKKQYQSCDLTQADGLAEFYQLIKTADILIANFRTAKSIGVDYDTLSKLNPRLIYANITGYGEDNPRGAYDAILQAETGLMSLNGEEGGIPLKLPIAFIDVLTAHQLKQAILLGLLKRHDTNHGCYIPISLYEVAVSSLANQATNYLMGGVVPTPHGSLHPNIAPYGETYQTLDKQLIILAVGSDKQFQALCQVLGVDDTAQDIRFNTNQARLINRSELSQVLQARFITNNVDYWCHELETNGVPAGHVKSLDQVFKNPLASNLIVSEDIEDVATKRVKSVAFVTDWLD